MIFKLKHDLLVFGEYYIALFFLMSLITCFICLSFASVMWGHIFEEVAKAAGEEIIAALNILQNDNAKRWQAIGMFKHVLASIDYTWEIKLQCIELLSSILDGGNSDESSGDEIQFSSFMTTIFAALQVCFLSFFLNDTSVLLFIQNLNVLGYSTIYYWSFQSIIQEESI